MVKRQKFQNNLQGGDRFWANNKLMTSRKMKLDRAWCTEDIHKEYLQFRLFSSTKKNDTSIFVRIDTICLSRVKENFD